MHNMYDQFYKFLSNIIIEFFEKNEIKPGAKYDIRLPNEEEVEGLYNVLTQSEIAEAFIYQAPGQGAYQTYALSISNIKVILASTAMKVTDAFLTALRNKVGTDEALFKNTAILFIHDSALDSILNGSESLQKIGMPLHTTSIQKVVETRLKDGDYTSTVKRVLQFVMANKESKNIDVRNALVEYREILEVLNQGRIDSRQYNEFGLFYDSGLDQMTDSEIKERLKENEKYYGIIFNYRQFNTKDSILEKSFTRKNMESIDSSYWNTLDFNDLHNWMEKNKSKQPIEYLSNDKKVTEEGLTYWEAVEKDSAAGRRTLNIIVFNPNKMPEISLKLRFDQTVYSGNCQVAKGSDLEAKTGGKQITVTLQGKECEVSYGRFKYKDVKDYNFKILVVPAEEALFKTIKSCYKLPTKISDKGIYIEPLEEMIRLNTEAAETEYIELSEEGQVIQLSKGKGLGITNTVQDEASDTTAFILKIDDVEVPMFIKGEAVKPKLITAVKLAKLKRENEQDFTYLYNVEENSLKLYQETAQYYAVDELLERLKMEIWLIESENVYCSVKEDGTLEEQALEIPEHIREAYIQLVKYYKQNQTLPSLATLTQELLQLMTNYVEAYTKQVESISEGTILSAPQKNLNKLGSIVFKQEEAILWSPLHPINMAYELRRQEELQRDEIDEQILKKVKPLGLVPFIKDEAGKLYGAKEVSELSWLKFIDCTSKAVHGKYELAKIVEKSIVSFTTHFSYLFDQEGKRPLRINLIGTEQTEVLLGGLLRTIANQLKKIQVEQITPIEIRIYSSARSKNVFHELEYDSFNVEQFLQDFDVSYDTEEYSLQEFMKIFRNKVSIYQVENTEYEACHISFVGLKGKEEVSYRQSNEVAASSYLGGMINAPTVYMEQRCYVKTVGMKGLEDNLLTRTVKATNALAYVGMSSTPFIPNAALATVMAREEIEEQQAAKQMATWTVYLEPKVDYSYFSQAEDQLIHYVDRLYAPSMIDAITLSHQLPAYKKAIQNKIQLLGLNQPEENLEMMMKLSNLLNGEWLIELLSAKKTTTLESINNPLLIRWSTELLNGEAFVWVPVSLHDFMRTCESVGIKSSKGLLKAKSYEKLINDMIWIGYAPERQEVCFYPISLRKAEKDQGVFKEFSENIYDQSFEGRYFRQLLVERGLFNLRELVAAQIFTNSSGKMLLDENVQSVFMQGDFKVVHADVERLGYEAKIIFENRGEVQITKSKAVLTIFMDQKKLWQDELQIDPQVIEVAHTPEDDLIGKIPTQLDHREKSEEKTKGSLDKEGTDKETLDQGNQTIDEPRFSLEESLYVPRYSIVYYFETLPEYIKELMDFYIGRGIKLFLVLNMNKESFSEVVGEEALAHYEELMRKQVLSLTYDAHITLNEETEVYIADGERRGKEAFYNQLGQTSFNIEQYEIEHTPLNEDMSVKAGAGTGKTKVMIDRIMYLKHIDPTMVLDEITMITFTNESMMEMRTRLANRLKTYYEMSKLQKYLKWMDELNSMQISTIHAFSMEVLKKIGDEIGIVNLQIASYKHRKDRLIEEGIEAYQKEYPVEYRLVRRIPQYKLKRVIQAMGDFLDNRAIVMEDAWGILDFGTSQSHYHGIFEYVLKYMGERLQQEKVESGRYEINDLIKMLREVTRVQNIHSKVRMKYLMVDEYQDTDEVQVEFVSWLSKQLDAKLFVVGDIKQSIYRFRGADYTAFEQLEKSLGKELKEMYITKNYRSNKNLLDKLNQFFKKLSYSVEHFEFDDKSYLQGTKEGRAEDTFVLRRLKDVDSKFAQIRDIYLANKEDGSVCVLTRTNAQVREVVRHLQEMKIPSIAETKGDFYRHPAVRDFYLLVRAFIYTERLQEWILLEGSAYGENKISYKEVVKAYNAHNDFLEELLQDREWFKTFQEYAIKAQSSKPIQVIRQIIELTKPHLKYARKYYRSLLDGDLSKEELLEIAKHQANEYEANLNKLIYLLQKQFTDQAMTLTAIEDFLRYKIATDTVEDQISLSSETEIAAVRVMTVHKSKGLEFDTVILPFTDSKFENYYSNQFIVKKEEEQYYFGYDVKFDNQLEVSNNHYETLRREESDELIGEETRLLYVACTRAKSKLFAFVQEFANDNGSKANSWQDLLVKR